MLRFSSAGFHSCGVLAGAVLLFLPLLQVPAEAQACWTPPPNNTTNITNSTTLCTGTYNLNVTLAADNLTLDCNYSLLFGNGSSWAYIIGAFNRVNITVQDCILRTAGSGIEFRNVSQSKIRLY